MSARYRLYGFHMSGPTYKVGLMLSLIGEPFDYVSINLREGAHKRPEYLARNRYGQVPCLEDLSSGRTLVQSASILEYLADRSGRFGGSSYDERIATREWMFWDFDRLAPPVFRLRRIKLGMYAPAESTAQEYREAADAALKLLDGHLAGRDWIVGERPTIADIDIYGVLSMTGEAGIDLSAYPAVEAFTRRFAALPGHAPREALLPREDRAA